MLQNYFFAAAVQAADTREMSNPAPLLEVRLSFIRNQYFLCTVQVVMKIWFCRRRTLSTAGEEAREGWENIRSGPVGQPGKRGQAGSDQEWEKAVGRPGHHAVNGCRSALAAGRNPSM